MIETCRLKNVIFFQSINTFTNKNIFEHEKYCYKKLSILQLMQTYWMNVTSAKINNDNAKTIQNLQCIWKKSLGTLIDV